MLALRMLALLPLLMMVGGVGAPADPGSPDPYEDWEAGWDGAQVRAPAAKKQKTPDQADADAFAAWEVVEEGAPGAAAPSGVYDVEMENILEGRAEAGLYAPKASTAEAGAREEELNPNVKETRRKYTLATKMYYIELAEIAQRDEAKDFLWVAVRNCSLKDRVRPLALVSCAASCPRTASSRYLVSYCCVPTRRLACTASSRSGCPKRSSSASACCRRGPRPTRYAH
jgi:hypothetical protein